MLVTVILIQGSHRTTEVGGFDTNRLIAAALIVSGRYVEAAACMGIGFLFSAIRKPLVAHLVIANIVHGLTWVVVGSALFDAIGDGAATFSLRWIAAALSVFIPWVLMDMGVFATFYFGQYQNASETVADWKKTTLTVVKSMMPLSILVGYGLSHPQFEYLALLFIPQLLMSDVLNRSNDLVESEVEKRELRQTFTRYVPESVVEQMVDGGEGIELGGLQREITVLFCDIRGFTSWSENLEPAVIVEELNKLLSELSDCVFATGGTLDKFTGDGLMAFWGAPVENPMHAFMAAEAAHLMVARLQAFNEQGGTQFKLGIGLHTGQAVVGNIGHSDRHDYTAIGDTVNLSARIEAATKEFDASVLISRATFDKIPETSQQWFADCGEITVKGRKQPVGVFQLRGAAGELNAPAA
jgi:class 3 adenylate cyclase